MKLNLFFPSLLLFLVCSEVCFSQASILLGPKVGYQTHAIINQNNYGQRGMDYVYNGGLMYGASVGVDFANKHIIQMEFILAPAGQTYREVLQDFTLDKEVNLTYVQIPLTYRFVTGRKDKPLRKGTNFHLLLGAYMGFLQEANMKHQINGSDVTLYDFVTYEINNRNILGLDRRMPDQMNPDFNTLFTEQDFGVLLGFGVQSFVLPKLKLVVDISAGVSLQDINAEPWRFLDRSGDYRASRNLFASGSFGVQYYLN